MYQRSIEGLWARHSLVAVANQGVHIDEKEASEKRPLAPLIRFVLCLVLISGAFLDFIRVDRRYLLVRVLWAWHCTRAGVKEEGENDLIIYLEVVWLPVF